MESGSTQRPPTVWYKISASEEVSAEWYNRPTTPTIQPQRRRIYRWGELWGVLDGSNIRIETHTIVHQSPTYQIERIETQLGSIPMRVDDIWEEEVMLLPNIEFNGLLSIVGNAGVVQDVLEKQGLPTLDVQLAELPTYGARAEKENAPRNTFVRSASHT